MVDTDPFAPDGWKMTADTEQASVRPLKEKFSQRRRTQRFLKGPVPWPLAAAVDDASRQGLGHRSDALVAARHRGPANCARLLDWGGRHFAEDGSLCGPPAGNGRADRSRAATWAWLESHDPRRTSRIRRA